MSQLTTLNEQLVMVALYMGAETKEHKDGLLLHIKHWLCWRLVSELKYNTSYDWLMPVANKVVRELGELRGQAFKASPYTECLKAANKIDLQLIDIRTANNTFDPAKLFTAVVSAIKLINEYKTKEK